MTGISNHARDSEYKQFGESVRAVGKSVCSLVESAAQSSYLIAIAEPGSKAGTVGLINQAQFLRALSDITSACNTLCDKTSDRDKVIF